MCFHPQVFVMPCLTSGLLVNLQYLDLSDNLLTDMTLSETLCYGDGTLKHMRVLNISGNDLKVLSPKLYPHIQLNFARSFAFVQLLSRVCPP